MKIYLVCKEIDLGYIVIKAFLDELKANQFVQPFKDEAVQFENELKKIGSHKEIGDDIVLKAKYKALLREFSRKNMDLNKYFVESIECE